MSDYTLHTYFPHEFLMLALFEIFSLPHWRRGFLLDNFVLLNRPNSKLLFCMVIWTLSLFSG